MKNNHLITEETHFFHRMVDTMYEHSSQNDLSLAYHLIKRNPNLIKDYPSLEDALRYIENIIKE